MNFKLIRYETCSKEQWEKVVDELTIITKKVELNPSIYFYFYSISNPMKRLKKREGFRFETKQNTILEFTIEEMKYYCKKIN